MLPPPPGSSWVLHTSRHTKVYELFLFPYKKKKENKKQKLMHKNENQNKQMKDQ